MDVQNNVNDFYTKCDPGISVIYMYYTITKTFLKWH